MATIYLISGLLWIWLSERLLPGAGLRGELSYFAAALKGTFFVVASSILIYLLVRREVLRVQRMAGLFRAIAEGTDDAVFIRDESGRLLLCNDAVARIAGRKRSDEVIGLRPQALFSPESAQRVLENDQQIMRDGRTQTAETTLTIAGVPHRYLSIKLPYRDENGEVRGVIGIAHDVTEYRRAEAEIRDERDRLSSMASAAPGILFSFRQLPEGNGQFLFVSPAVKELTSLSAESLRDNVLPLLLPLIHPDDFPRLREKWASAERDGRIWHDEFRFCHPTRGELWIEGRAAPGKTDEAGAKLWHGVATEVTARKLAEAALEASHAQFRGVIDHVTDAIYMHGQGSTIIDVNNWACESLGHPAEAIIGQTAAFLDPDFDSLVRQLHIGERLQRGETVVFDSRHRRRDGTLFPVEVRMKSFRHASQMITVSVVHDLSERVRAEAALRAERDRFDTLASIVPGVLLSYRVKPDGSAEFPYASPAVSTVLGLSAAGLSEYAAHPEKFIHPDDQAHVDEQVMRSARELTPWICEYRFRHPQQGEIWIEGRSCPVREPDGSTIWHGILTDVTARALVSERVRASEQRFRELADAIPQIVWTATPEGALDHLNARAVEYTGLDLTRLTGGSWASVVHPEDLPRTLRGWGEVLRRSEAIELEFRIRRHDGQYRWHVTRQVPARDASGAIVRWYGTCTDIDDQKQAAAALRAEHARFENMVATVPGVIFSFHLRPDGTSHLPFVSSAAERMCGLRADQLVTDSAPLIARIHPDDLPRTVVSLMESGRSLTPWRVEFRLRHPSLGERWVEGHALPIRDLEGGIAWQGYVADISERKSLEAVMHLQTDGLQLLSEAAGALLEATDANQMVEQLFRMVAGHIGCDIFLYYTVAGNVLRLDAAAGIDDAMRAACQTLKPGELLCGSCAVERKPIYIENIQARSDSQTEAARRAGIGVYLGHPLMTQDRLLGTLAFASRTKRYFTPRELDFVRTICHYVATAKDRLRTEAALRESEEKYRRLVDILPAGVVILIDKSISFCNSAFAALMGEDRAEQLIGRSPFDLVAPEYHELVRRRIELAIAGQPIADGVELRARQRDGKQIPLYAFSTAFLADGRWAVLVVILDLTQRERDLNDRKRLEEQFRQSQKMEALGRLAGGVAHDFNNLLTVINGHCDLVLPELPIDDRHREAITSIRTAGERAARLTEQLLSLSRKALIEPKLLDLNVVIDEAVKLLRRLIGEDITVTTILEPRLGAIRADRGQLDQVIMNLAVNARDAMPTGGRLTLQTSNVVLTAADVQDLPELKPGCYVELSVRDTGCGMTDEVKAKIFEPFFTTKDVGKGTGLGLAVVHGAITQADGHISVQTQVGQGTMFTIRFPQAAQRPTAAQAGGALSASRGTETILLVEDEAALRKIASLSLTMHGYQVIEAPSGREALRLTQQHKGEIHLLITDVVMPEMGGRKLVEALRAERPELKVLYMSGYTDDSIVRHGVADATDAFLQKPFTPTSLVQKVRATLDAAVDGRDVFGLHWS